MDFPGIWGGLAKRTKEILEPQEGKSSDLHLGLNVIAASLARIGGSLGNALEEVIAPSETKSIDESKQVQSLDLATQLKASRDVAMAMAAKVKLLLQELKGAKQNLEFAQNRCSQLEEENRALRETGLRREDDELVRRQLETLIAEKARLSQENSGFARENQLLREVIEYHSLSYQDASYIDESIQEVAQSVSTSASRSCSLKVYSRPEKQSQTLSHPRFARFFVASYRRRRRSSRVCVDRGVWRRRRIGRPAIAVAAGISGRISSILPSSISTVFELFGFVPENASAAAAGAAVVPVANSDDHDGNGAEVSIRIIADPGSPRSDVTMVSTAPVELTQPGEAGEDGATTTGRDAVAHRYDFQHLAKWVEQFLPFTALLLVVFIRQHLQGFLVTLWISALMIKANNLLRKQTALRAERKTYMLVILAGVLLQHVEGIYWLYRADALWRPLLLLPPRHIPSFSDTVFNIIVNDTMVRLSAMAFKCGVLIYYKKGRGRNYRWQGQILTLTEYVVLLYRALIPGPVWYRFFLNKEYGSLFSSLTTGLYLTFKVTSVLDKVQKFVSAVRSILRWEVQYGSYATSEEIIAAGDLCAICQEKLHAPISLCCKHVFCEDCVSEWLERERTCPLCRSVVKSSELRSFGDGSTSLFIQLF